MSKPLSDTELLITEIDAQKCVNLRRIDGGFGYATDGYDFVYFDIDEDETELSFAPDKFPYFENFEENKADICDSVLEISAKALAARLERSYSERAVLGVSGGLDSTMAQLIAVRAMDILGRDRKTVVCVTMPCFGTTNRTKSNAQKLSEALGVTFKEIDIKAAVTRHLEDIGHEDGVYDVVYENAQARERTQVLMDMANGVGGLVVGTGDLSELALGFATYNGDHMSMYAVNASIPKTLMRHMIERCAERYEQSSEGSVAGVLRDILATPVSPELLPADNDSITQCTEQIVGPYALHDFFLYNMLTYGFSPKKILRLATVAFRGEYSESDIRATLKVFIKRFFAQQFKRSCLPDGPRVCEVSLSPRGAFMMPSDSVCEAWLCELE
jgi:NAD+ synthase (glutamine-hydrolysing)